MISSTFAASTPPSARARSALGARAMLREGAAGKNRIGRYQLFDVLARGGMARVHLARLIADAGFTRVVAVKRMHAHLATDHQFVAMFRDEARLLARIRHPNVVPILDVVSMPDELFLVMEYVSGESLSQLMRRCLATGSAPPPEVSVAIIAGMLSGLHAAHEAESETGKPLAVVHRDVSPQNVIVGDDGFARVLDFGIAHASERLQATGTGEVKGKLEYMPPEQLAGARVDRRCDVYAAGVVLWEALTGRRLFKGANEVHTVSLITEGATTPPSAVAPWLSAELDAVVMRALARDPKDRYATAREFAAELTAALEPAACERVAAWVRETAGEALAQRRARVREIESSRSEGRAPETRVTRAKAVRSAEVTQPATPNHAPRAAVTVPMAPEPLTGTQRRSPLILIGLVGALAVVAIIAYGLLSVRKDFERGMEPIAAEPKPAPPVAAPGRPKTAGAPADTLAPELAVPSAWPTSTSRPRARTTKPVKAPSTAPTATATAKRAPVKKPPPGPECNPPWVMVGKIKMPKRGCE